MHQVHPPISSTFHQKRHLKFANTYALSAVSPKKGILHKVVQRIIHFILGMDIFQFLLTSVERVINCNVQISSILAIRPASELSIDNLIALHISSGSQESGGGWRKESYTYDNRFLDVKYNLLPMCIFRMRPSTKSNRLMTRFESNIEPCYERMNKIISCGTELEVCDKGEIRDRARVQIEVKDTIRISDDGAKFNRINEGFAHCDRGNRGEIEAVD